METFYCYYSTFDAATAAPSTTYSEPHTQMVFSGRCLFPEANQYQTQFSNQWDECNLEALLFDIESVVSSAGLPVSSSAGYHHNCAQLPTVSATPTHSQKPVFPAKQRKPASVSAKRAKQNERDTCKRNSDERAFWNFLQVFGPHSKSDHSTEMSLTKAEKADCVNHMSQAFLKTYESWPQEKRNGVDEFLQRVRDMFNKRQLEPEMKRRRSKTCKQRWANNQSMWCRHCSVPLRKKACLIKGKATM
ncbi:uncharacterized protein LOC134190005 isoform X2 [Corticium candelabrum]|uniref:uncharacterized protein LOC134190005 isoform X2 n=1 Tax=Corticium candelabrum TaxID=121492 RepID=UPI002E2625A7|nr:uncharacterized protein LOC134190005 isoform X2 [Corticium candelabrum]